LPSPYLGGIDPDDANTNRAGRRFDLDRVAVDDGGDEAVLCTRSRLRGSAASESEDDSGRADGSGRPALMSRRRLLI
jgi:hypothetical protein